MAALRIAGWIALCVSLVLVFGSGAERAWVGNESDYDSTMFYAGVGCFAFAGVVALILKATGNAYREEESSLGGVLFLSITALLALAAGIALDIAK